jgi:RNA polymerase sigma factor for flagellar operon FliA
MGASAVVEHLSLVRKVAGRIARRLPSHVSLDDLVSAGTEGLLDAARKFDPTKGVAFGAYAEIRIRGAVMDELRQHDFVPRSLRRRRRALEQARLQAQRAGTDTSDAAVSARLGLKADQLASWLADGQVRFVSFDEPEATELPDEQQHSADEQVARLQQLACLRDALALLPARLQTVLSLYYVEDLTLKEIGAVMGVTESRVCQLHGQALKRIREILG